MDSVLLPHTQLQWYYALAPGGVGLLLVCLVLLFRSPGWTKARPLLAFLGVSAAILLVNWVELSQPTTEGVRAWSGLTYLFITLCPVTWFLFARWFSRGCDPQDRPRALVILLVVPLITTALVVTNPHHSLIWTSTSIDRIDGLLVQTVQGYGSWFWVHFGYSYILYTAGTTLILSVPFRRHRLYQRQILLAVVGSLIPVTINLVYILRLLPGPAKDFSPLAIVLSGIAFTLATRRYGLAELAPANQNAPERLSPWGWFEVRNGRIVDGSQRGFDLLQLNNREAIGTPWSPPIDRHEGDVVANGLRFRWEPLPGAPGSRPLIVYVTEVTEFLEKTLSRREQKTLAHLRQGLTNKEIGQQLGVAESTVKSHVHSILKKLGKRSRAELLE